MAVTISIRGLANAKGAIRKLAKLAPEKLSREVARSAVAIHGDTVRSSPVDTGILRGSYKWEFEPGSANLSGVVYTDSKYGPHVEFGTKPHFPPVAPLEEWARRHGMPGAGYAIAKKIAQRGTPAQPHLGPAAEREKHNFVRNVKAAVIEAGQESAA